MLRGEKIELLKSIFNVTTGIRDLEPKQFEMTMTEEIYQKNFSLMVNKSHGL